MLEEAYYVEIAIEIDGWRWNLADEPVRAAPLFPSAEKLLERWEHESEKRAA